MLPGRTIHVRTIKGGGDRTLAVSKSGSGVTVDGANVVSADIRTDNGVIHVIDKLRHARRCSGGLAVMVADAGLDVVHHGFADDRFTVGRAHMFDGTTHHFRILFGTGVPLASGDQGSAFKLSHDTCAPLVMDSLDRVSTRNGLRCSSCIAKNPPLR
eukprot:gene45161-61183_t